MARTITGSQTDLEPDLATTLAAIRQSTTIFFVTHGVVGVENVLVVEVGVDDSEWFADRIKGFDEDWCKSALRITLDDVRDNSIDLHCDRSVREWLRVRGGISGDN